MAKLTQEQVEDRLEELMKWKKGDGPSDFPAWSENLTRDVRNLKNGSAWKVHLLQLGLNGLIFLVSILAFMWSAKR